MPNLRTVLTRHLATLFPDKESARTIVTLAEIPEGQIDFDGRSLVLWTSILRVAVLQQKVPELLAVAREEFANDAVLRDAAEALTRDPHLLDLAKEKDLSSAPQQVWTTAVVLVALVAGAASLGLPYQAIIAIMVIGVIVVRPRSSSSGAAARRRRRPRRNNSPTRTRSISTAECSEAWPAVW